MNKPRPKSHPSLDGLFELAFPRTDYVGRCAACGRQVLGHLPHEHVDHETLALAWPDDPRAVLVCGRCSNRLVLPRI